MARIARRGTRWSLRQAHLAADVTQATARGLLRSGVLDPLDSRAGFTTADVLALKVAATVAGVVLPGETRPANVSRDVPARQLAAVAAARQYAEQVCGVPHGVTGQPSGQPSGQGAVLLVYPQRAELARTAAELAAAVLSGGAEPYLVLPVGNWLAELLVAQDVSTGSEQVA